ncbi:conserved hypothetical protein [Aeromonas phage 65]|uniref:Uncharacterized protein n=2 Tax=Ishigurovirus osborne TaxID=260149 RepID=A0A219YC40_9CAUD|nr:hypothetical protein ST65p183 [Aeromonas phage 65]ADQ53191.1 conserved hypothetical protein [Aeromonas phage 65]APU01568.1 hypothetical protein [Aeromonas phage 65.2]
MMKTLKFKGIVSKANGKRFYEHENCQRLKGLGFSIEWNTYDSGQVYKVSISHKSADRYTTDLGLELSQQMFQDSNAIDYNVCTHSGKSLTSSILVVDNQLVEVMKCECCGMTYANEILIK